MCMLSVTVRNAEQYSHEKNKAYNACTVLATKGSRYGSNPKWKVPSRG